MKAHVDAGTCIGCTQCAGICPEVFSMSGNLAEAMPGEIPPDDNASARQAADSCPVNAIALDS